VSDTTSALLGVNLGTNVPAERYVEAARTHGARIIGISALFTTTMTGIRDVVRAVRDAGMGDVGIILGGAPVTAEFAREIGADGYAPDAGSAVEVGQGGPGPVSTTSAQGATAGPRGRGARRG
jgi:5-methyltetrahydrofolate--homocysteine methyltransferase